MSFNSITYGVFFLIVFFLYWFLFNRNVKFRNAFLLIVSYIFYGWWDWRFLILIFISSITDFLLGLKMNQKDLSAIKRKHLLYVSIGVNLGILGFFKYYNFFVESFTDAFAGFGINLNMTTLGIILPVGISFYTFQTLSYTIDVYRKKMQPTNDLIAFLAFVSFFPQLVAGPIERAHRLLPQFQERKQFNYKRGADGLRQILWGLVKKIVVADNCSVIVDSIFNDYTNVSGGFLIVGVILFLIQLYCDFSGYSDIAIGSARLLGFDLMKNFDYPFFARNFSESWRKWHISLSSWFRDYVFIPFLRKNYSKYNRILSSLLVFSLVGLWHGASWNFVVWGFIQGLLLIPYVFFKGRLLFKKSRVNQKYFVNKIEITIRIIFTFLMFSFTCFLFRAQSLHESWMHIRHLNFDFSKYLSNKDIPDLSQIFIFIAAMLCIEWFQQKQNHGLDFDRLKLPMPVRWGIYLSLTVLILIYGGPEHQQFFYFQF